MMAGVLAVGSAGPETAPASVLLMPLRVQGSLHPDVRTRFVTAIAEGLGRGATVKRAPEDTRACDTRDCWRALADAHGVAYVARPRLEVDDHDYRFGIRLVDPDSGGELGATEEVCEVCGVDEAATLASRQASAVWSRIDAVALTPPRLVIRTVPPGADVSLDGKPWGSTPVEGYVTQGRHRAVVSADGYASQEFDFALMPGMLEQFSLQLSRVERKDTTKPLRVAGWTTLAVGGAATIGGAVLLALHGRDDQRKCSGGDVDAEGDCRYRFETLAAGATTLTVGLVSAITGTIFLAVARKRRRR